MSLDPGGALHLASWDELLRWLPSAKETQLVTVFLWAGELASRGGDISRPAARARKEAFEQLVLRSRDRLRRYLNQRCGCRDPHFAEDVVQQVLIKLFLRAGQYDPRRSFWGWLYRIARNEHIDMLRRLHPGDVGRGQAGRADDDMEQWLEQLVADGPGPVGAVVEAEQARLLERAIEALPALQRSVVRLKREGVKGKEVAARLGISQAYVSQLYHEAGEVLREAIEGSPAERG